MNEIKVVNKRHLTTVTDRHFYVGRPSPLGNPFVISATCTREQAIKQYDHWLLEQITSYKETVIKALEHIAALVEDNSGEPVYLVCYCAPNACHADVIKRTIEQALS